MTKKTKMVLFLLSATAINVVLTVICFSILMLIYTVLIIPRIPDNVSFVGFPLIFLASLVIAFIVYQMALKLYLKKHPLNEN